MKYNVVKNYYSIVEEDNDRPYAYYLQRIKWDLNKIVKEYGKDGYIVQKVSFSNNTGIGIKVSYGEDYYEAWKVINGHMEYGDFKYDDEFSCGYPIEISEFLDGCKEDSIGKKGKIQYICEVYWVEMGGIEYEEVMKWKTGPIGNAARELPSIAVKDCKVIFKRLLQKRDFIHTVDYDGVG